MKPHVMVALALGGGLAFAGLVRLGFLLAPSFEAQVAVTEGEHLVGEYHMEQGGWFLSLAANRRYVLRRSGAPEETGTWAYDGGLLRLVSEDGTEKELAQRMSPDLRLVAPVGEFRRVYPLDHLGGFRDY
jgi:hypothetical protein